MPHYRLYRLNAHSGHIDRAEEFHAADDDLAIAHVQEMDRNSNLELWQEGRKVRRFDAPANLIQKDVASR